MARHGTPIVAAYICALSSSPTEDSGDLESVYRMSKSRGQGVTYDEVYSSHSYTWYVGNVLLIDERLI